MIPIKFLKLFDFRELELLISGLPDFNIEDLKSNVEQQGQTSNDAQVKWLWEILYELQDESRAAFLQFVTGSSKVPLEGFRALQGIRGHQKMQIYKSYASPDSLPTAHTCFNQLDLPVQPNKNILKEKLICAISEGKEGFGFM